MTTTSLTRNATLAALLLTVLPFAPGVSACTPGSLLCPVDGVQEDAYAAVADAEAQVMAAPSALGDVIPMAGGARDDVIAQEEAARNDALDMTYTTLRTGAAGVHVTLGRGYDSARDTADATAATVNGVGDAMDATLTDGLAAADKATAEAVGLEQRTVAAAGDLVSGTPGLVAAFVDPVADEAQEISTEDVPELAGEVGNVIGGIDIGPALDAADGVVASTMGMLEHNYSLIQARFPSILPPFDELEP